MSFIPLSTEQDPAEAETEPWSCSSSLVSQSDLLNPDHNNLVEVKAQVSLKQFYLLLSQCLG